MTLLLFSFIRMQYVAVYLSWSGDAIFDGIMAVAPHHRHQPTKQPDQTMTEVPPTRLNTYHESNPWDMSYNYTQKQRD